ncbi:methylated-DNA--[protein]-cysteine S-methyltransferase [Methanocella arvoryzae]|uniref:methylated-DNA--[protein]-cysteine S-methyltransferase n=1 Tax=Methanocella arvoryzae (strain DSM 22066 / NBRC 105507 / MRE50) TaxID=351160 RepID=Q0W514_METAR|nr:methylated-DNA--[protein]-cysteine S-methyltransferase [Methanocella arvoryzae]CAJ36529.1 predicted 6-O-methylguanine-DNA methyltransferase [Methanocella arvoryzae MRE50]
MVADWIYAEPIGLYVIVDVDVDGKTVETLEMTRKKPAFKAAGTPVAKALEAYFRTGSDEVLRGFDFDRTGLTPFRIKIMEALRRVPAGETVTYGELAAAAGSPGAARAVGNVMARNPVPIIVPCHRVVATNGLGGFTGGLDVKRKLLRLEGAEY